MIIAEHIEFDQLPAQCKCILSIATMAASLRSGNRRRQSNEALTSIARCFWNELHLAPSDLRNPSYISKQLCIWLKSTRVAQN